MCALYAGRRDAKLVKHINQELIKKIIDTQVGYYKIIPDENEVNIYNESLGKRFYSPILIHSLIDRSERDADELDGLGQTWQQIALFSFLRDELQENVLTPEVGDVIEWDNDYYEIDSLNENQLFMGKNQDTWFKGDQFGYDISITVNAHVTNKNLPNIENVRTGWIPASGSVI